MRITSRTPILFSAVLFAHACNMMHHSVATGSLNVMSFNIRLNTPSDGENAWPHRKELVANIIQFHQADFVGLQEALKGQLDDLSDLAPEFAWIGVGRDDGREKGEYSAILYSTERFEVLQQGTFWLSETPEQAGSLGWDAAITRVVTWGKFKDRSANKSLFIFNTHFDHLGEKAREESAKLLLSRIQSLAASEPAIVTGDFNAIETSPVYQIMVGGAAGQAADHPTSVLRDARYASLLPHYGPDWTYHGFGQEKERTGIDYIFVNQHFKIMRHAIISDPAEGRYSSDHFPVFAEMGYTTRTNRNQQEKE